MWSYPQESANLVTFTEEILNGKLHFLSIGIYCQLWANTSLFVAGVYLSQCQTSMMKVLCKNN